ncbi:hypothetical protein TNCV_880401 [Trichonephila clavipes]|nr:hypothetical protein TNCV_880401 [Trichonephila clavipes]
MIGILSKIGETTLVHYVLTTNPKLHDKLWKPTLTSRESPKCGRTGPELCSFPVLTFFWGTPRYLGCSQWVGCPTEGTGITHVQVLQQASEVKHTAPLCLFWPVH